MGSLMEVKKGGLQKSYFDVLRLCCSSEVPLIEKILKPLEGVVEVSVIVPSRTVIVLHDSLIITQLQILKALNQGRLEANIRVVGKSKFKGKWPSHYVILSGLLLGLSFLKYFYHPLQWLAVAAVAVGVWPIILNAVVAVRTFTLDVNILMLIAVVGTIVMKDYTESATIVFLFTIADWLQSRASHKASAVMSSLLNMTPQKATIADTGEVISVEDVKLNTVLAVKAGEIIPVDGVVVEGTCEVDEKTLTGESYPVPKQKDSTVLAGTVNVNGYISVKTTSLAQDCVVAKLASLVEEAQNKKSNVQMLIDRIAKYYTPGVVIVAASLAGIPAIMKLHNLKNWCHLALVVLVSACPCGLILSTPVATFCALSKAGTMGLLIKGGDYLEILAKLKFIAFDKTGTLTRGEFTLMSFDSFADDVGLSTLLYWVSSIESKSSHPISSVLVDYSRSQSIEPKPENVGDFQNFPGEGVSGKIDGREIYIGNKKLANRANCTTAPSNIGDHSKDGRTAGYVYFGGNVIGSFSLSDNCRTGAKDAIRELNSMGIKTAMLTGDSQSAANHAQEQLENVINVIHAELLPEDKAKIIENYKREGLTAMVGDGVNDAPALATADVGISMGVSGSKLATETGHVILMSNDIRKIPKAVKLARKTRNKVIQNIVISVALKAGVLAVAVTGHPLVWLAVLVDVFTCLLVILNSMLLLRGDEHRFFGLFSCHGSHKNKHDSISHQHHEQCCSTNAAPKACESSSCCSVPKDCSSHNPTVKEPKSSSCCSSRECQSDPHDHYSTLCEEDHCCETVEEEETLGCTHPHRDLSKDPSESEHRLVISDNQHEHHHHHHHDKHKSSCEDKVNISSCEESHDHHHHDHGEAVVKHACTGLRKRETLGCTDPHREISEVPSESKHHHHHHHDKHKSSCEDKVKEVNISSCEEPHDHDHHSHDHGHHHHHHHDHDEAVAKHACTALRKREVGACCKSFRKECCGSTKGNFTSGFGGLKEIVTE